jgi:hypothetical protein
MDPAALTYQFADLNEPWRLGFEIFFCRLFFKIERTIRLLGLVFMVPSLFDHSSHITEGGHSHASHWAESEPYAVRHVSALP